MRVHITWIDKAAKMETQKCNISKALLCKWFQDSKWDKSRQVNTCEQLFEFKMLFLICLLMARR